MTGRALYILAIGLIALLGTLGLTLLPGTVAGEIVHKFHVSYARMGVEENIAVCQIRFFRDDLYETLVKHYDMTDFELNADPDTDRLFIDYFNKKFRLEVNGSTLSGTIVGSGEDIEGKEEVWWYTIQFTAEEFLTAFRITNTLLTEQFDDQKNILKIQHFPSEKTLSYYFDVETTVHDVNLQDG